MRVLIADGDIPFLGMLQSFLRDGGHEIEVAADGLGCRSVLRDFVPEVLVIERDLLWGGSDGVLAVMRDDPDLVEVPVILITNRRGDVRPDWCAIPPIAGSLQKPFRLSALLRDAAAAIQQRQANGCGLAQCQTEESVHQGEFAGRPAVLSHR